MVNQASLIFLPAHALAQGICDRQFSATEVLEAHLRQIKQHNAALNAIVTPNFEAARQRAQAADAAIARGEFWGPLHGVPITIKDNWETAGLRTTVSYPPLKHYVPQRDAAAVARLKAAGAIVLGKTNMPKLAKDLQTDSPLFGQANNPWNLDYTCGGSTGGGSAAVAAGLSAMELGSDAAGSIRIPAHFCGLFSLKPTENRVSLVGQLPPLPNRPRSLRKQVSAGLIARCIEDLELGLMLIEGPDGRDWEVPPVPQTVPQVPSLENLRLAWTDRFGDIPVTPETNVMLQKVTQTLSDRGAQVKKCSPLDFNYGEAWETFGEIAVTELYSKEADWKMYLYRLLSLVPPMFVPGGPTARGFVSGMRLSFTRTSRAMARRDRFISQLEAFLGDWDAWICPVCPQPAFPHAVLGRPMIIESKILSYLSAGCSYTSIFNLTGNPVVVVPVGFSPAGLPMGVQIVGRRWCDRELLAIAKQIAKVTGDFTPPPGY